MRFSTASLVFCLLLVMSAASCVAGPKSSSGIKSERLERIAVANAEAGRKAMQEGDYRAAIQYLNKAIALYKAFPKDELSRIYVARAFCLAGTGQYRRSLDDANWAVEKDSSNAAAYFQRGMVLAILGGDPKAGLADVKKAVNLDPENEEFKQTLEAWTSQEDSGKEQ